jgi:hypothetical protein
MFINGFFSTQEFVPLVVSLGRVVVKLMLEMVEMVKMMLEEIISGE